MPAGNASNVNAADGAFSGAGKPGDPAANAPDRPRTVSGGAPGGADGPPPQGEIQAGPPPIQKRPQSTDFPEKTLDSMRRVRRIIGQADERLRDGEVTDAFLGRMGMSNAEFRRFVASWQRKLEAVAAAPVAATGPGEIRTEAAPTRAELLTGDPGRARPVTVPGAATADGHRGLVQGSETPVSPRLQPAVSAYFEKVGRMGGQELK
jgi:hypothetical protein